MSTRAPFVKSIVRWLIGLLLLVWCAAAIAYLGLRYYVWPRLDQWRPQIIDRLSHQLGRPVVIDRLHTELEGWRPTLTIEGFELRDVDGQTALRAEAASASLSLARLLAGRPSINTLTLVSPSLTAEYFGAGQWRIAGFDLHAGEVSDEPDTTAIEALLAIPRIEVREGRFEMLDRVDDSRIAGEGLSLAFINDGRQHRIALRLDEATPSRGLTSTSSPSAAASPSASTTPVSPPSSATVASGAPPVSSLELIAHLKQPLFGSVQAWREWEADWFIGARNVPGRTLRSLSRLVHGHRLSLQDEPSSGSDPQAEADGDADASAGGFDGDQIRVAGADLLSWGRWQNGGVTDVLAKLDARRPRWRFPHLGFVGELAHLRAQWRVVRDDDGTLKLVVDQLSADLGRDTVLGVHRESWLRMTGGVQPLAAQLALAPFEAADVLQWAADQRWPTAVSDALATWQGRGRVSRAELDWQGAGPAAAQPGGWRAQMAFENLSLGPRQVVERRGADGLPLPTMPGVELARGTLDASDRGGRLQIEGDAKGAWLMHGLFEQSRVVFDQWAARLGWSWDETRALRVEIDEFRFANADLAGTVRGSFDMAGAAMGLRLNGRLDRAQALRVPRYLPLSVPPSVRNWVATAVKAGTSNEVTLALDGDPRDFPFDRPGQKGVFRVETRLRDGVLAFAPGWPAIEQLAGRLIFDRSSMQASIERGSLHGVSVAGTSLAIPDMHHGVLGIEGRVKAPAAQLIRLVNHSPLDSFVNGSLQQASATGDAEVKLAAQIPLNPHDPNTYRAELTLLGNNLQPGPGKPALTALHGAVQITHEGVSTRDLQAQLLGGPLRIDASAPQTGQVALSARGTLSVQAVRELADNALTRKLSGQADYEAQVDFEPRGLRLTLSSTLTGVRSELPPPFAKQAGDALPLRIVSTPATTAADGFITSISLGDDVRLQIGRRFDAAADRALIDRAAFAMGTEPVLPERGLAVALRMPRVDFDAWSGAMASAHVGQSDETIGGDFAPGFSLLPSQVSVVADELLVGGKQLHNVVFGATRQSGLWQANVGSREIDGYFTWRDAPPGQPLGKLTARFTRLEIPPSRRQEIESMLETDRTDLPELDVMAEELVLNNHRLGKLKLLAGNGSEAGRPAWRLQQLQIVNPAATLDASGVWTQPSARAGQAKTTSLDFRLSLRDAGELLDDFGLTDVIRNGAGLIQGQVDWRGSPLSIDYPSLHGRIKVEIGKGQFLKTDPGLAKLIGVLNLQSLPRRLSLDFRDIFAEGFAFDDIAGDVRIEQGVAHTDELRMNGVQARVFLRGEADLAHETQSLDVEVRPHLNAGLASLAYAAVNPVIGLGSFVAQVMLRKPLEAAFTYRYQVTGPWADPVVVEKSRTAEPDSQPSP